MELFVLITGCSGGGKSTLIDTLARRGHGVVPEPGRRIIASELACRGGALPWMDMVAFAQRALALAITDHDRGSAASGPAFFDRDRRCRVGVGADDG